MKKILATASVFALSAGPSLAQAAGSSSTSSAPDISPITANLDFKSWVIPGMISVAAALAVVYVARAGISMVMGIVKSAR